MKKKIFFLLLFICLLLTFFSSLKDENEYFQKFLINKESNDYKIFISNLKTDINIFQFLLSYDDYKNIFYSSFGLQILLSYLLNGVEGLSNEEIGNFLIYTGFDINIINDYFKQILSNNLKDNKDLLIANSLWINKGSDIYKNYIKKGESLISKDFEEIGKKYYLMDIFETDITQNKGFNLLEKWIAKKTENRIKNFIKKSDVTSDTLTLLINAIYFKDKWLYPFDEKQSSIKSFKRFDSSQVDLQFMKFSTPEELYYYEDEFLQAVRLPYKENKRSLIILLPKEIDNQRYLNCLQTDTILNILSNMRKGKGYVSLPKIKAEFEYDFKEILTKMGLSKIFEKNNDFNIMFNKKLKDAGNIKFCIDKIKQKTYIEIDEKGTKAAAVTLIGIVGITSAVDQKIFYFNADHPFFYFIIDDISGNVIFNGLFSGN